VALGEGETAVFWTLVDGHATISKHSNGPPRSQEEVAVMIAVIGNVLAGIGVLTLFMGTLRLTKGK
jgi:hypothetical protein